MNDQDYADVWKRWFDLTEQERLERWRSEARVRHLRFQAHHWFHPEIPKAFYDLAEALS